MTRQHEAEDELRDVYARVADMHRVLEEARGGDHDARLRDPPPEAHPLAPLHRELDALLAELAAERERSMKSRHALEEALANLELTRAALRELSTPIIEVWRGVLCLPIIGMIDSDRSGQMMRELLAAITAKSAAHVIIDVTAVDVMDSATLDHFISMASAARLLGATCVLTGLHPEVAQTWVRMEVDVSRIATHSTLRDALTRILSGAEAQRR